MVEPAQGEIQVTEDLQTSLSKDDKNMGVAVHLASFSGYLIPFGSILGPLIVWLMKRDEIAFVAMTSPSLQRSTVVDILPH